MKSIVFARLKDAIGIDHAMVLIHVFGGTKFPVPKINRPDHRLVDIIGKPAMLDLIHEFGGMTLNLPKVLTKKARENRKQKHERNAIIREMKKNGYENSSIARQFGLTTRRISSIANQSRQ
ncbi:MAG: hypothetical protein HQL74_07460 [Magnetococcales bacterium]|nr:hypothetical protein [Magnetococcales bacterium]